MHIQSYCIEPHLSYLYLLTMYNIESFMNLSYFIVLESFSALEMHFLLVYSFDSYKIIDKRYKLNYTEFSTVKG